MSVKLSQLQETATVADSDLLLVSQVSLNISSKFTFDSFKNYLRSTFATVISPALTGTPTAPTPTAGDNSTQLATTEFVKSEVGVANSDLVKTALNASGTTPIYACRAWVNFNGTGTVAIRASGNVSSITDNGLGQYKVNFITAMPDNSYSVAGNADNASSLATITGFYPATQNYCLAKIYTTGGGFVDRDTVNISIFR